MKVENISIRSVYEAHMARWECLPIRIEWEGDFKNIVGEETRVINVVLTSVEIAARSSTPGYVLISLAAEDQFREAVRSLLESGTEFYTCLRNGWNIPNFLWKIAN